VIGLLSPENNTLAEMWSVSLLFLGTEEKLHSIDGAVHQPGFYFPQRKLSGGQ
jgi:hypothetical protein